jgi:hypothetical protein
MEEVRGERCPFEHRSRLKVKPPLTVHVGISYFSTVLFLSAAGSLAACHLFTSVLAIAVYCYQSWHLNGINVFAEA